MTFSCGSILVIQKGFKDSSVRPRVPFTHFPLLSTFHMPVEHAGRLDEMSHNEARDCEVAEIEAWGAARAGWTTKQVTYKS